MADVLISGAGPTGLVLALWLTKQNIKIRIIDKSAGPGETSRAMVIQARTLELYRQLGMSEEVVADGFKTSAMNIWARGMRRAQVELFDAGEKISPYPFALVYPQDRHERFLVERLRDLGVEVERDTELLSFIDCGDGVIARLKLQNGREETCKFCYVAGCDGAHSTVRHQIGGSFEGGTYKQLFYVADVQASGVNPPKQAHIVFESSDIVLVIYYGQEGLYRLIGTARDAWTAKPEHVNFEDVAQEAINSLGIRIEKLNWFSTYRVHHRVADTFGTGKAFLLGDAAHVHSPAGGQGMNTGIHDAINLAWKLAAVLKGKASVKLLDSYDSERRAFARKLVETTDRLFTFATAQGSFPDFVRTWIAPVFASIAFKIENVREYPFRIMSQTMMEYHDSAVSEGQAGEVKGGDRLPFVRTSHGDNYSTLSEIAWQVHVYGTASPELEYWCARNGVRLYQFLWHEEHRTAGLARNAAYLLRPDTFVALSDSTGSPATIERYFAEREIIPGHKPGS